MSRQRYRGKGHRDDSGRLIANAERNGDCRPAMRYIPVCGAAIPALIHSYNGPALREDVVGEPGEPGVVAAFHRPGNCERRSSGEQDDEKRRFRCRNPIALLSEPGCAIGACIDRISEPLGLPRPWAPAPMCVAGGYGARFAAACLVSCMLRPRT